MLRSAVILGRRAWFAAAVTALAFVATACSGSAATVPPSSGPSAAASAPTSAQTSVPAPTSAPASAGASAPAAVTTAPTIGPTAAASSSPLPATPTISVPSPASPPPAASAGAASAPPIPSFAFPSLTSDKELEAALPNSFMGVTLHKLSLKGTSALGGSTESGKQLAALLTSLGKTADDISVAVAVDSTNKLGVTFVAERIVGVDASVWAPQLYRLEEQQIKGTTVTQTSLGGRDVSRVVEPGADFIAYAWPSGDILFVVSTKSDALAGPAIGAVH